MNQSHMANISDQTSVLLCAVHNIGAGGVLRYGHINISLISSRRLSQMTRRMLRAKGYIIRRTVA